MKKILFGTLIGFLLIAATITMVMAAKPTGFYSNGVEKSWEQCSCTTIQSGELETSTGETITTGYDKWGYNYQAHMFNGGYCDSYQNAAWCQPYADVKLVMKWNDKWLSNSDCDEDGLLDKPTSYIGTGAWQTSHQFGSYELNGETCKWNYFLKLIAAPADAIRVGGVWYLDDVEIGDVWGGQFVMIEEVYNDPCAGYKGLLSNPPAPTGFGFYN